MYFVLGVSQEDCNWALKDVISFHSLLASVMCVLVLHLLTDQTTQGRTQATVQETSSAHLSVSFFLQMMFYLDVSSTT